MRGHVTSCIVFFNQNVLISELASLLGNFLARPLNLAAMSDLRSGVLPQTQEILHLPGVSEIFS